MQLGLGLGLGRYSGETDLAGATNPNFIMEVGTSLGDGLASMALPIQGTQPMTVDWGDGTVETVTQTDTPASDNWVTHSYASGGVYEIKVSKTLERVYFNRTGDSAKATKVLNWGDCVWSSFEEAFSSCSLTELPSTPILNGQNVTNFTNTFFVNQITSIPEGLFDNCPNVNSFDTTFRDNKITSIPEGLFDNCPNVTNFNATFNFNLIESIPLGLFDSCPNVTNFKGCFANNLITLIPQGLFNNCPNVTNFNNVFLNNTLPVNDLSRLYIELSLFQTQNNVPFHGGSGQYDPAFALLSTTTGVERSNLVARGWTLTDAGPII